MMLMLRLAISILIPISSLACWLKCILKSSESIYEFWVNKIKRLRCNSESSFADRKELAPFRQWTATHQFPIEAIKRGWWTRFCAYNARRWRRFRFILALDLLSYFETALYGLAQQRPQLLTIINMAKRDDLRLGVAASVKEETWMSNVGTVWNLAIYCLTEPGSGFGCSRQCYRAKKTESGLRFKWL